MKLNRKSSLLLSAVVGLFLIAVVKKPTAESEHPAASPAPHAELTAQSEQSLTNSSGTQTARPKEVNLVDLARQYSRELNSSGWEYGSGLEPGKVDCVWFNAAVLKHAGIIDYGAPADYLNYPELQKVLIAQWDYLEDKDQIFANYQQAVETNAPESHGAPGLIEEKGLGSLNTDVDALEPNSIIQYHWIKDDGNWFGHAGVVSEVVRETDSPNSPVEGIYLISAHNRSDGIGEKFVPRRHLQKAYWTKVYQQT